MKYPDSPRNQRPLYRARGGWIFGVARGLATYSELPVFWIRLTLVITFFMTGFFPVAILYVVAAFFMKPEPVMKPQSEEDWEFYNSYASSRSMALARLKRKFDKLESRARRIEAAVTAREFDWEHRLRTGQ